VTEPAQAELSASPRERDTAIAVAKVRPVRLGSEPHTPRVERTAAQPEFAVAGVEAAAPRARAPSDAEQAFPRDVAQTGALQPSTLQAQAAQIEAGNAPAPRPVAALAPDAPRTAPARARGSRGPFEIQIGAYGDSAEAERRMAAARQRAGGMLDAYHGVAIPVQNGKLYRARFRGFDATAANAACSRLKTMQIDCFVTKTE
jgi:D-alanyl-D-alanine carboxypeptidase